MTISYNNENFPNLEKETDLRGQKAQRVPDRIYPKRTTPRHTVIQTARVNIRENINSCKGKEIRELS